MLRVLTAIALVCLIIPSSILAQESLLPREAYDMKDLWELQERVEETKKNMKVEPPTPDAEAQRRAESILRYYNSPEYQDTLKQMSDYIRNQIFPGVAEQYGPVQEKYYSDVDNMKRILAGDERLYIMISSSVPIQTLRTYADDLDKIRDPNIQMVLRGFVNGAKYVRPTLDFIKRVTYVDPSCDSEDCQVYKANIIIDPTLFSRYRVEAVPAFVYVRGVSVKDPYMTEGVDYNATYRDYAVLTGDISIEYALELFRRYFKNLQKKE